MRNWWKLRAKLGKILTKNRKKQDGLLKYRGKQEKFDIFAKYRENRKYRTAGSPGIFKEINFSIRRLE